MTDEKRRILDLATRYLCPGRVRTFAGFGIDLAIGVARATASGISMDTS